MSVMTANRRELLSAITIAASVLPSKTTMPLLEFALFEVDGELLTIKATDNELRMVTTVACKSDGKFVFAVPAQRLRQVLSLATEDDVKITVDKTVLQVDCGGKSRLPTADPSEYPEIVVGDMSKCWKVPFGQFKSAFSLCQVSADATATRYAMAGVLIDVFNASLVASDSRRMAVCDLSMYQLGGMEKPKAEDRSKVFSMKFGKCVCSLDGESVDLLVGENTITARVGRCEINAPLVQGLFPNWKKVMPEKHESTATVVAGPFVNLLRRAAVFTAEETVGVEFCFGDGSVSLKSTADGKGAGEYSMPISMDGESVSLTMNPTYTIDLLSRLEPESSVEVRLIDGESPVLFLSGSVRYVQMPLNKD